MDKLNSQDFYELMQSYRNSPMANQDEVVKAFENVKEWIRNNNTRLEKHSVCTDCLAVGVTDPNCICTYGKYERIELEYEVCNCCGNLIDDGNPADTEFNKEQFKTLNR